MLFHQVFMCLKEPSPLPLYLWKHYMIYYFPLQTKNRHLLRKIVQPNNSFVLSFHFQVVSKEHTYSTKWTTNLKWGELEQKWLLIFLSKMLCCRQRASFSYKSYLCCAFKCILSLEEKSRSKKVLRWSGTISGCPQMSLCWNQGWTLCDLLFTTKHLVNLRL